MKFTLKSFRIRIIVTLTIVVSLFSSASIYTYNQLLYNKIYEDSDKNIENILYFLKSEIIDLHNGSLIKPTLINLEKDKSFIRAFLMDAEGNVIYPSTDSINVADTVNFSKLISDGQEISVMTKRSIRKPSSLGVLQIDNQASCHECHPMEIKTLGYVALKISLTDTRSTLIFARVFSILFTVFMIIIILVFVVILHVRFIKASLSNFQIAIKKINEGNLNERVEIKKANELARLGHLFNQMVDNFQRTQQELTRYHQKELDDAEKLATIGEMAARLAHDVRNPLTGIANSIEIIMADIKDSPHTPILQEIRRQTNRVNESINNLLKFSRTTELNMRPGNINDLLKILVSFLKNQKQNSKVVFDLDLAPDLPEIKFDPEQMENVLMNISFNAIQAMRNEGKIIIKSFPNESRKAIIITIEDNGPGIPDEIKDDIFKPFYTTRTEGTGLGLAIARDTIKKHCGKIWFENKEKGGTIFFIRMPVMRVDEKGEKNTG